MTRITSTGRNHWQARSGYLYQSAPHARLERPEGEPSILRGACIIALPVIVVSAMIVAFT